MARSESTANDYNVSLFVQDSDGSFAAPQRFDVNAAYAGEMGIAVGDLNGDGLADVAVTSPNRIHVFYAQGGTLSAPVLVPGTEGTRGLDIADMDGDGDLDLVSNRNGPGLLLVRNDRGSFAVSTIGNESNYQIAVGDLTGDGRVDVVGLQGGTTRVYRQLADGTFAPPTAYAAQTGFAEDVAVGDLNGDGRADLARTDLDGLVDVHYQNAAGGLDPPTAYTSHRGASAIEAADVDVDGLTDLVVSHRSHFVLGFYMQNPDGTLGSEDLFEYLYAYWGPQTIAVADLDSDGRRDLVTAGAHILRQLPRLRPRSPGDYRIAESAGATILPGVVDIGLYCDDCVKRIELPFPVPLYERWYSHAWVASNGALFFDRPPDRFDNRCAPSHLVEDAVFPAWADLYIGGPPNGVFTAALGTAPHRRFVVEWRAYATVASGSYANFEVVFHEDSGVISTIYGDTTIEFRDVSAGIQRDRGTGTSYGCNDRELLDGTRVDYVPQFETSPTIDLVPPETTIASGPSGTTTATAASFTYAASEPAGFECSIDGAAYGNCTPPSRSSNLAPGDHSFKVRAVDTAGNRDQTPAERTWVVTAETTVLAAGDIADCMPGDDGEQRTATIIDGHPDATVAALGDLAYFSGTSQEFQNCYGPSWGRHKARTRPTPGNHDYETSGAGPYFTYFEAAAGTPGQGWYSYDLGGWHIVVLNSNCAFIDCTAQMAWLRADLAAHPVDCTVAYWHHPLFTSGTHADDPYRPFVRSFWDELYARGVEVILNGHDHDYERFAPLTPAGTQDLAYGIREFVVGTGGAQLRGLGVPSRPATSEVFYSATYGVLKLVLRPGSYDWQFLGVPGTTFTDSGTGNCHGPEQTPPESNPTITSSHTSAWSNDNTVDVTWSGASDSGSGLDGYSYSWTQAAGDSPDEIKDVEETVNSATSDPLTPDGDWWFHLRTKDNAGNWSSAVHLGPVRIDTVAPTNPMVSSSHVQGAWSNDTTADVSWTGASDDRSGVEGYSFFWTQSAADVPDTTKEPAGTTSSATLTDGQWWFHLRTRDSAGNWSGAMHSGPFRIDTSLPANPVPSSTHPSSWSTDNTVDVAWSGAADTGSGVDGFSYSWTQQATSDPGAAKGVEESAGSANSGPLPDGDWWFHLRTRDNAGNWSAAVHLGPFRIDTAPPTNPALSSSHVPNDWSNDSTVEVNWTGASDLLSGVDGYAYSWTQQDTSDPGITKTAEDNVGSATSVPLPDGSWWFHLRTRDNAGNWSAAVHRGPFKIDTTAPTNPTLSSPSHTVGEWSNEATVVLEWDAQAGHAYSYRWSESQSELPDETPEPGHSWVVETLRDGSWWFLLRTRDSAGSWSGTARLGPFLVDTTAPVATITAGPPGATTENTAAFEFVVSESASLSCGLDGATPAACASPVLYGGLATGGHVFRLQASDRAGNQSGPAEWRWTIVAAPPPPPPPPSPPQPPPPPPIDPPPKRPPQVARCVVPRIIGRTVRRARIMISSAGCRVGRVRTAYSPRVRKGLVLTQGPRAGRRLPRGTRVGMVVSLGKKPAPRRR